MVCSHDSLCAHAPFGHAVLRFQRAKPADSRSDGSGAKPDTEPVGAAKSPEKSVSRTFNPVAFLFHLYFSKPVGV
jgi:hypothetical protein